MPSPAQESRLRTFLRRGEVVLLIIGFLCLGVVGFQYAQSAIYQGFENYQLDQTLKGRRATVLGYLKSFVLDDTKEEAGTPPVIAEGHEMERVPGERELVGRIEIPRLDISAVIREGVDSKTLSHAVGHVPSSALPGRPGNVAIAAHRDTFFRPVRGIKKDDLIRLVTASGTYDYKVESMRIVWPSNVSVLKPTPEPMLTLVTCYPFNYIGSAPKRFIVRARQVTSEANARAVKPGA